TCSPAGRPCAPPRAFLEGVRGAPHNPVPSPGFRMKLSVVVPVYNEKQTVRQILQRILATPHEKEVILVDDGSTDGTRDLLREIEAERDPRVRIFLHEKNGGKGSALRTGFAHVPGDHALIPAAAPQDTPASDPR